MNLSHRSFTLLWAATELAEVPEVPAAAVAVASTDSVTELVEVTEVVEVPEAAPGVQAALRTSRTETIVADNIFIDCVLMNILPSFWAGG